MAPHDWTTEGFGAGDLKDLNIIGNIPTVWKETVLLDFADSRKESTILPRQARDEHEGNSL
jgi:hypothetical protein